MCEHEEPWLSRYADNELSAKEAARVAAHLADCPACTESLARLTALRSLLVGLAPCDPADVETSRLRVFRRFRQESMPARPVRRLRWQIAAPLLAAAALFLVLLWPASAEREPLPTEAERGLLFDLHDAHTALNDRTIAEEVPS